MVDVLGLSPSGKGKGEGKLTRSPDGTDNPGKKWKDDPKRPGWGWQKGSTTGKRVYKKKPHYLLPPKALGPVLALRIVLQMACEAGDSSSCRVLCKIAPEACEDEEPREPLIAVCPVQGGGPSVNSRSS